MRSYPARALAMDGWRSEDSRAFDHSLSESEAARVERIRAALEGDRLRLLALPVADLRTGEAAGEELLVRLVRSNGRLDRPAGFMPAAERGGLAVDVDRWVLDGAARLAASGRQVHVNVSPLSISQPAFPDAVARATERHGADPAAMTFEVAETAATRDTAAVGRFAARVEDLGAQLAIDDFGTAHESLAYVTDLPIGMLKIDARFVRHIAQDGSSRAVVETVVALARRLGLTTVAKGVEDEATRVWLRDAGVDLAQGFHVGLPTRA